MTDPDAEPGYQPAAWERPLFSLLGVGTFVVLHNRFDVGLVPAALLAAVVAVVTAVVIVFVRGALSGRK